jgi:hypothetical protein
MATLKDPITGEVPKDELELPTHEDFHFEPPMPDVHHPSPSQDINDTTTEFCNGVINDKKITH